MFLSKGLNNEKIKVIATITLTSWYRKETQLNTEKLSQVNFLAGEKNHECQKLMTVPYEMASI